ncbi:MAG: flagellar biosynthesis protein FliQ [Legionellaceae bacterium]|nr:flagellar biosynthesis protein FliQ [Legionellaceae bacterium]
MTTDLAIYLSKSMLWNALLIASPVIATALVVGLLISLLQVITQIQDATLSFVPKILAVVLMLMLAGEWMLHALMQFARASILGIPGMLS